ncbi:MAG: transcription-repair coupling factor, partial [Anaerolineae bacterium]|nr:transcription-repair coupling factor [Anaerolineae bacterium]
FTARIDRAYNVSEQLPVWLGEEALIDRFAEPAPFFYERAPWSDSSIRNRLETLSTLTNEQPTKKPFVVVASARALMQRTLPPTLFRAQTLTLAPGQRHVIDRLLSRWIGIGYEPATIVVIPGTFSRRGGILDIYPIASDFPVRIEFFDDEIDSLRKFDPATQRSTERIERFAIPPAREALPEMAPSVATQLADWFAQLPATDSDPTSPQGDMESLSTGVAFPQLEHYLPYLYQDVFSLLDYAPDNALIVTEDEAELRTTIQEIEARAAQTREEKEAAHHIAPSHPQPHLSWSALEGSLHNRLHVSLGLTIEDDGEHAETASFRSVLAPEMRFAGQLKMLLTQIRAMRSAGDRIVAVSAQAPRLVDLWHETDSAPVTQAAKVAQAPPPRSITFIDGTLQEGWRLRTGDGDLHLLSDAEIFGWSRPEPQRRPARRRARTPELSYSDLNEGDFVVHVDYGIGRFAGMRRRMLEGIEREYLSVEYAGTDVLFVPIHQTDRLTRYIGPDDKPPTLNKLGQPDWTRIKGKAKKAVEEEAKELLALYAGRASATGHAYSLDTPWQAELEASFPFIETEDQLRAVRDVKMDMEKTHPMDRLICGDVGYGKTEVALRAAFKAVMDGKQVAILVPTTILAQQHYETFRRRMSPFPATVEALSRFRSRAEQTALIGKLRGGDVDIVIGTHRLLQSDVRFKNLGLVIIDEEQRFGVKHKEHLKSLRMQVDVLTLTATPIPRTLYMGLTGVRDISMIQTPPEERLPIVTHVGTFDERLVRQAVLREMERGGQVFIVHNRVQTIGQLREKLERIIPEARIAIGHGQMDERLLESVMVSFGNGECDVLLATSIIESGLDIPNANTLIVDRADLFGMAQLYQLRGRVGRSAQQAYAYLFHPATGRMTEDARMRLETLAEYVDLGSGFQIAMRDLELRGAG